MAGDLPTEAQMKQAINHSKLDDAIATRFHDDLASHNERDLKAVASQLSPKDIAPVSGIYGATYGQKLADQIDSDKHLSAATKDFVLDALDRKPSPQQMVDALKDDSVASMLAHTAVRLKYEEMGINNTRYQMDLLKDMDAKAESKPAYRAAQSTADRYNSDIKDILTGWSPGQVAQLERLTSIDKAPGVVATLAQNENLAPSTREFLRSLTVKRATD